jgi:hypothetical protein
VDDVTVHGGRRTSAAATPPGTGLLTGWPSKRQRRSWCLGWSQLCCRFQALKGHGRISASTDPVLTAEGLLKMAQWAQQHLKLG